MAHSKVRRAPKTQATSIGYLRSALDLINPQGADEITTAAIQDCLTARAETVGPKTLNHIRAELKLFCGWLVDRGELDTNPVEGIRTFHVSAPVISWVSLEGIEAIRKAVKGTLVEGPGMACLYAGLRRGEAIWLDWRDVDFARGLISIKAKTAWQPKTKRNRVVPLSSKLRAVLETMPASGKASPVFLSPRGKRWDGDNLTSRWRSTLKDAGVPGWTLLDMRHTFATHLIRKPSMSFAKLAALMGNSPEICRRHYAHVATEDMAGDVEF